MKETIDETEREILKALWLNERICYRQFIAPIGLSDKPLRRRLERLQKKGYIVKDKPPKWKRGMKIPYYLLPDGEPVANQLVMGDLGRELFVQALEKLESIAELPDDQGEKVLKLALDIINMLSNQEKSTQLKDVICNLINKLRVRK